MGASLANQKEAFKMTCDINCPDAEKILAGLKPFQRDTVEYVFQQLYFSGGSRRFLVADEVGLGKTLVARGVIAKTIELLWDKIDRIDVVYICSNTDIARQNINRLNITGQGDFAYASRLTLLPATLSTLNHKLNFVSFTPGTSFDLRSSTGIQEERALLFHLLRKGWGIAGTGLYNLMQCDVADKDRWRERVNSYEPGLNVSDDILEAYFEDIDCYIAKEKANGEIDLRNRLNGLCDRFSYYRKHENLPVPDRRDRNRLIGELRAILARTCLKKLEPDIVILDEFQRFKHLLTDDSDAGELARELFEYSDEDTQVRTLLLSATPYKMYTLYDEEGEDDHYQDFLATLVFLENDRERTGELKSLIEGYRREMYRFGNGNTSKLFSIKNNLEVALRRTMVRTERVAYSADRDDMIREVTSGSPVPDAREIQSYLGLHHLAGFLDHGDPIEYWKSAPYLLNFMDHYKFKENFLSKIDTKADGNIVKCLKEFPSLLLSWDEIGSYEKVDPGNARLRKMVVDMIDCGSWRLLWIPPSFPYYKAGGPFKDFIGKDFTKRLVFSSWAVVPKVIAAMMSYEAERKMFRAFDNTPLNTPEERKKHRPLLRFAYSNERYTGMPLLGLLYPSFYLARLGDPIKYAIGDQGKGANDLLSVSELTTQVEKLIDLRLQELPQGYHDSQREDESWYWAGPILLDLHEDKQKAKGWLEQWGLARLWAGGSHDMDDDGGESRWADHVAMAIQLREGFPNDLGRRPKDLARVLAQIAIAGPGVTTLRALCRIAGGIENCSDKDTRNKAGSMAWSFRKVFNQPEVMCMIRGLNREEPYWRRVLEYCLDGGIQSVMDEYVHVLNEFLGVSSLPSHEAIIEVANAVRAALSLMTSRVEVDNVVLNKNTGSVEIKKQNLRNHFALRFGIQKSENDSAVAREDQVRLAFNSPFWPFVLASTSVGQEGLDFHPYCHAVVHWNLPSNPVDMEQREGRIHRYKGHAVRKNLVKAYRDRLNGNSGEDLWEEMFSMAKEQHWEKSRGMVPYWSFPVEGGSLIERHVPNLPLSRDFEKYQALKKSLVVYRMVFGQSRQEDVVEYLLSRLADGEDLGIFFEKLQIDLGPLKFEI
jgi:hypothetical protein